MGRCPRQQAFLLSPALSLHPLGFGSYHGRQLTLDPHGVAKMARRPGARGAAGPRTQGAGPEGNPGSRSAPRSGCWQSGRPPAIGAVIPEHPGTCRGTTRERNSYRRSLAPEERKFVPLKDGRHASPVDTPEQRRRSPWWIQAGKTLNLRSPELSSHPGTLDDPGGFQKGLSSCITHWPRGLVYKLDGSGSRGNRY